MFTSKFNKMYRHVIAQMNDDIMTKLGYSKEVEAKNNGICPQCNAKVDPSSFRDEVSAREFKISGLCQACQDEIFGTEDYADDTADENISDADYKVNEEDLPDDLNAYLHAEDPEDFRNDDFVNDKQDFQDQESEESQEESDTASDEDFETSKDLQDDDLQDEELQDEDLCDLEDEDFQDDDLQDEDLQDDDFCDLEDEDLQDDDLCDLEDEDLQDFQDEDIKDTDQDFEEEFQDEDFQDEEEEQVIAESKKKPAKRKTSKK